MKKLKVSYLMKDKIVKTALKQFLKKGIRDITIPKLMASLKISSKTLYKHFENKEQLLQECVNLLYLNLFEDFRKVLSTDGDPVSKIKSVFTIALERDFGVSHKFYYDLNYYYPEVQNASIRLIAKESGELLIPVVEQGIRDGYFLSDLDPYVSLRAINMLYSSITRNKEEFEYKSEPRLLFKQTVIIQIRGMCTEKGLKYLDH
ncbi:TetR/AcrR family transcriptional regulator [Mucilaginibacter rubeus]|uniref:TetR/AcrR family transcriptional regulator n=1 Tax=Mucilaginibacter rubeus TaxID=2027860 RepID=A0AAE6MHT8_9SPHI|nr:MULTISPECIES: TetR/AcrR family transcriptional regulator [Mucilaginibacter]QEM03951.1 TetR/AcrR family transcriptional regulator [Mucilaginibacter rubeus]QEM16559.1 TetR/AcrR family transcriptional regulator [Mucilaginibacter gossypii]QTE40670.1 TetR/AcrR family transcriptional regulator [Mucilaginibacter rubeus]QTE47272.1 TetR/AcrR family transcriptional regulator [Mucilaginibacter rubeus]QTE58665.1 TetR/AcrR family transcriptional regulator [Mucilaginibacter rubeus]